MATSAVSTAAVPVGIFVLGFSPIICAPVGAVCAIIPLAISFIRHMNHKKEVNVANMKSEMQMYNAKFVKKPVLETNIPTEQPRQENDNTLTPEENNSNKSINQNIIVNLNNQRRQQIDI